MSPDAVRNCLHCSDVFEPDVRHRHDQRYCRKPACQMARRAVNNRRWREQPEHKDWWRGEWNVQRVREWRAEHPGYWKRWKRKKAVALQSAIAEVATRLFEKGRAVIGQQP